MESCTDAEPSSRTLSSGLLEIEFEMPAEHAETQKQLSVGDSSDEWEDVGGEGSMEQPSPSGEGSAKGKGWRERAAHRQKYWSRMTGFQFGRKLGDWGKDEDPEAKASKVSLPMYFSQAVLPCSYAK